MSVFKTASVEAGKKVFKGWIVHIFKELCLSETWGGEQMDILGVLSRNSITKRPTEGCGGSR